MLWDILYYTIYWELLESLFRDELTVFDILKNYGWKYKWCDIFYVIFYLMRFAIFLFFFRLCSCNHHYIFRYIFTTHVFHSKLKKLHTKQPIPKHYFFHCFIKKQILLASLVNNAHFWQIVLFYLDNSLSYSKSNKLHK